MFDFSKAFDMLWKNGLIHKLRQLGLSGNIIGWITDFLSDRKIRVRVNNILSSEYLLQNGTPQGSVISPLLFLIMINDYPPTEVGTETSLYADDSAIWRSGKQLQQTIQKLNTDVQKIQRWCDLWGFKLNEKKTVAIIFSKNNEHLKHKVDIRINGKQIETVSSVKFLGLTFDQRLNWAEHINNVVISCKKKINLMRSLTGQQWGASKTSMLKIYRTLIRPRMEYGVELFHTASKAALQKLNSIQYTCLRLACGAMRGTAADALQQECGEMPLSIRRQRSLKRYTARISTSDDNPAKKILQDHWQNHYGKFKSGAESVYLQTEQFHKQHDIQPGTTSRTPPWQESAVTVDTKLQQQFRNTDNAAVSHQKALEHLHSYKDYLQIYTDASVNKTGQSGAAFYIPAQNVQISVKLSDHTASTTAELLAIKTALQFINSTQIKKTEIAILTDSSSSTQAIEAHHSKQQTTEAQIMDIAAELKRRQVHITIVWVPSHTGLHGNETADRLAKQAATKHKVDIKISATLRDFKQILEQDALQQWQAMYDKSTTARQYKLIEKTVSTTVKYTSKHRHQETLITRLKLGKCRLHNCLHRINRHDTGHCDTCHVPETVEHFILNCPASNIFYKSSTVTTLPAALLSAENTDFIYNRVKILKRQL